MGIYVSGGEAELIEKVQFVFNISHAMYEVHQDGALGVIARNCDEPILLPDNAKMRPDDEVILRYSFQISYLGTIVETLEAVEKLCDDPSIPVQVRCEELEQGRILVQRVLTKLEDIIRKQRGA